jgi:acetyl-CoA synthetase
VRLAVPKAFLALRTGFTADRATALSIFQHLKAHLSPYKRVRRLQFADLPKTISGKIRRVELRGTENKLRQGTARGTLEFWEEDFPELK